MPLVKLLKNAALAQSAAFLLLASGCVTEIQKPLAQTNLFTVRSGDDIRLSWITRRGEEYSVWYADALGKGAQWKVLPGCERLIGTGEQMEKTDRVASGGQRYYRIVTKPAK